MVLVAAALAATTVQPPEGSGWLGWALSVVCGALATVSGLAWKSARDDLKAEREEKSALVKSMIDDVVPALTKVTEATNRATEVVARSLDRERR